MTNDVALKKRFDLVLRLIKPRLASVGYIKKNFKFVKIFPRSVSVIEFQKSQQSSKYQIKFTINAAVLFQELWDPQYPQIANASSSRGHIIKRIGRLLPEPSDFWWYMNPNTNETFLAAEVEQYIFKYVLPFLAKFPTVEEAKVAWDLGEELGKTSGEIKYYLSLLK
mgnify:CR=1 FL=1